MKEGNKSKANSKMGLKQRCWSSSVHLTGVGAQKCGAKAPALHRA